MKFITPKNIFTSLLLTSLSNEMNLDVQFKEASLISTELESNNDLLGIIPSCDLIKHQDLFVSRKIALSFDGILSNAYFYFTPNQNKFTDLYLSGDVSSNEIILSKILFKERYSSEIQLHLDTEKINRDEKNYLIIGDRNLGNGLYSGGLSYSDELSTMIFLPYVNFVIASKSKELIESFNNAIKNNVDDDVENSLKDYLDKSDLGIEIQNFISENFNSVYYEMTESEKEGLMELLQLPYFHGIYDDLFEVKFI